MLPPPTSSFTIPSIHDGLVLQCRVYHPTCLMPTAASQFTAWRKRTAIVAHPYAPLGGCYDDPVVDRIASTILKEGFIVGTFNFRGAGTSQGRTSWQSKPERNDYTSFIGFMVYYLHHLHPPSLPVQVESSEFANYDHELHILSPIPSQVVPPSKAGSEHPTSSPPVENPNTQPVLLLSGYSYGALITTSLPPIIASSISPFQTPIAGSPHAEIRMRAAFLADQQNELMNGCLASHLSKTPPPGCSTQIEDQALTSPKAHGISGGVRIGGHEDLRKSSHESPRSGSSFALDPQVRRSVERVRSIAKSGAFGHMRQDSSDSIVSSPKKEGKGSESSPEVIAADDKVTIKAIPNIGERLQIAYLLVSPLHGWVNSLATMSLLGSKTWKGKAAKDGNAVLEHEMKLTIDPTLALFGDDDVFVSVNKLRAWVERMHSACEGRPHSKFRHREVPGAGHFWHSHEALLILREEVKLFVSSL